MKLTNLFILGFAAIAATSCSKSENEWHYFNIESPSTPIYADQYTDTLSITSTDSWEATNTADWLSPETFSYKKNYRTIFTAKARNYDSAQHIRQSKRHIHLREVRRTNIL